MDSDDREEAMRMSRRFALALCFMTLFASPAWGMTVVIAQDATWPPMEFLNERKEVVGLDTDYMKAPAKGAGFEIVFKNAAWDGIFAGLDSGQHDAVCSSVTVTDERTRLPHHHPDPVQTGQHAGGKTELLWKVLNPSSRSRK
jgi:ABC-type amino acid transport substrate-binding protein